MAAAKSGHFTQWVIRNELGSKRGGFCQSALNACPLADRPHDARVSRLTRCHDFGFGMFYRNQFLSQSIRLLSRDKSAVLKAYEHGKIIPVDVERDIEVIGVQMGLGRIVKSWDLWPCQNHVTRPR